MPDGESTKVHETTGNSGLTVLARKDAGELPEEIVEKIICRIPFPSLFKARLLSRTWYFKFPLAPQPVKSLSPSVQNLVSSVSSKWATYCPCYVSHESQEAILGFDRASARWQTLMTMSHLPISTWSSVSNVGPIVCVTQVGNLRMFITNALNRSWRKLNFPLGPTNFRQPVVKIIMQGSDAYKVLILFQRSENSLYSSVYDSSTRTYKGNTALGVSCPHLYRASAYLDGKLYYMSGNYHDRDLFFMTGVSLWMYNMENNEWSSIANSHFDKFGMCSNCGVLLCGDKVMVVVCAVLDEGNGTHDEEDEATEGYSFCNLEESIHIFELDVVTLELKPVSSGPPRFIYRVYTRNGQMDFTSDSNFIYFGQTLLGITMLSYNIHNHEWDCLPPASSKLSSEKWMMAAAFQPGLCPFMIV